MCGNNFKISENKNTLVNTQYSQPAGQIKQYEKYLKAFLQKMKKADQPTYIQRDLNLDYHTFPKVNKY